VAVGLLIDHVGFRPGFVLAAVLPLLAVALGRWVPRREGVGQAVETASTFGGAVSTRPGIRVLLQRAPFRRLILVNLALSSGWDAHSFTVPLLGHARGYSASTIGFILGAFALAATVVRLFISRWADDLDESKALQAAMALACVVFATYAAFPGPVGMCCASALLGLALGAVQPMVLSLLHQVTPSDQHGLALGFRMMATHLATIAMPLGFGLLAAASAAAAPMWLVAGLIALALIPARHLAPAHPSRGA
jgi:predicted MFS family arabinose efflux permease